MPNIRTLLGMYYVMPNDQMTKVLTSSQTVKFKTIFIKLLDSII